MVRTIPSDSMLVGLVGVGLLAALAGCSEIPQGVSQSAAPETIATGTAQGAIDSGTVTASVVGALSIDDALARAALLAALLQGLGPDAVSEVKIAWERHAENGGGGPARSCC